jgi:hypothetical protein
LTRERFRLCPFRSPLLGVSLLLSLPPGTEMFQFPGFPVPALCIQTGLTGHDPSRVSPFGDPRIDGWLTPPLGLSQSPTSFIGSRCQGIHRVPLSTCRRDARARYGVLKDRPTRHRAACRLSSRWSRTSRRATEGASTLPQSCTRCSPKRGGACSLVIPTVTRRSPKDPQAEVRTDPR